MKRIIILTVLLSLLMMSCDNGNEIITPEGSVATDGATDTTTITDVSTDESTSPPSVLDPEIGDKLKGITRAHNEIRAALGIPPLTWDENIAIYAQEWADYLAANEGCSLIHRSQHPDSGARMYGENLAGGYIRDAMHAVHLWVSEEADYDYETNSCAAGAVCGHYTQVVWASTTHLGCGYNECGLYVCNYDPPGNYMGQKPY